MLRRAVCWRGRSLWGWPHGLLSGPLVSSTSRALWSDTFALPLCFAGLYIFTRVVFDGSTDPALADSTWVGAIPCFHDEAFLRYSRRDDGSSDPARAKCLAASQSSFCRGVRHLRGSFRCNVRFYISENHCLLISLRRGPCFCSPRAFWPFSRARDVGFFGSRRLFWLLAACRFLSDATARLLSRASSLSGPSSWRFAP